MVQFTTTVNASLEKVWSHLLYKIEHPENFVPGVSNIIISERNSEFVLRQMTVTTPENSTILKEKITFIPFKVRFLLLEHPSMEGFVDNDIRKISENETEITFTLDWRDKTSKMEINNLELLKNAVLKTKTYIEEN
ncbi:AtaL-like protein [Flavobacterium sp.]|uniref:AtaL-like protein n=1 Tax=Flavobacterium sp. TaxID=239 RepID=UPI00404839A9